MSQSHIASARSATAAEGRTLLEKPSGTMCSPPRLGGCNSSCERPIGCTDTTRKAPCCGKPHLALGVLGGLAITIKCIRVMSRGPGLGDGALPRDSCGFPGLWDPAWRYPVAKCFNGNNCDE